MIWGVQVDSGSVRRQDFLLHGGYSVLSVVSCLEARSSGCLP